MINLFKKRFPFYAIFFIVFFSIVCTYIVTAKIVEKKLDEQQFSTVTSSCNIHIKRNNLFQLIMPILFVDNDCESVEMNPLKSSISDIIEKYKHANKISSASVYVKNYSSDEWICVNPAENFIPGSLLKLPIMMAVLKMAENNPSFLDKKTDYQVPINTAGKITKYKSASIEIGKKYSVRELLTYMIKYSDNEATGILTKLVDENEVYDVFTELNLPKPDKNAINLTMNAKEISIFMRSLFNAGYLNNNSSEFAMKLLTESDFKEGILLGIPNNIVVAHKFGESGDQIESQLHEMAIVYSPNGPYLITVLTKGNNKENLSKLMGEISSNVYTTLNQHSI